MPEGPHFFARNQAKPATTLSIEGDFDASLGMTYEVDLSDAGTSDVLAVTGSAALAGNLIVDSIVDPTAYAVGDSFTVLTAASIAGQFDNLPAGRTRMTLICRR